MQLSDLLISPAVSEGSAVAESYNHAIGEEWDQSFQALSPTASWNLHLHRALSE